MSNNILPSWDLSDLYSGPDDPLFERDLKKASELAKIFSTNYRGKIDSTDLDGKLLGRAMRDYLELLELVYKPDCYADLLFSADTSNPENGALMQRVSEECSRIITDLIFFDLELGRIGEDKWRELRQDETIAPYLHYIEQARINHRYSLSEAEETVLEETANCRGRAFIRLFTETISKLQYSIELDGELKKLNLSELLALFHNSDRQVRKRASKVLSDVLCQNIHPLHFAYSAIILEHITMDRLRGFTYPEESRHISNELPATAIETMVDVVVKNYPIVARFYKLKSCLLDIDPLYHYDRYAPLPYSSQEKISFEQAKKTVLEAFGEFDPKFRDIAEKFFTNNWIDAALRPGKRGGAFCSGITPKVHPYILLNFTSNPRDVETLAHELGHGIHDVLASKQNLLNYHPVLPLAETASTFAELLVFEKLLKELPEPSSKLALVAENIESIFATVFRQVAMYRFEQRVFYQRKENGELTHEQMSEIWQECLQEMFGDSVIMGEEHRITWSYVPHFVNSPFYVYAYAFGELLVLALYARYRQEGAPFRTKYMELLESGGSMSPQDMLAKLDIDITKAEFWQGGCDLIAEQVDKAEYLSELMRDPTYDPYSSQDNGWGEGDQDGWDGYGEDEEGISDRLDWDRE